MIPPEGLQDFLAACRFLSPEIEKHWLAPKCSEGLSPSSQVGKSKIRRRHWREQPRFNRGRQCVSFLRFNRGKFALRRLRLERFHPRRFDPFFNPHSVIEREVVNFLHQATRPAN